MSLLIVLSLVCLGAFALFAIGRLWFSTALPMKLQAARLAVQADDRKAVPLLESYLEMRPEDPEAWWLLADWYRRHGQGVLAKVALHRILEAGLYTETIDEALVRESLARIHEALGEAEQAVLQYTILLRLDRLGGDGLRSLARWQMERGNLDEAERLCDLGCRKEGRDGKHWRLSAEVAFHRKEMKTALYRAEQADAKGLHGDPDFSLFHATVLFANEKYDEALETFRQIPASELPRPEVEAAMAECFYHVRDFAAARRALEKLVDGAEVPDSRHVLLLGSSLEASGDWEAALTVWKRIQENQGAWEPARLKIDFYEKVLPDDALRQLACASVGVWRERAREVLSAKGFTVREALQEDERKLEFSCVKSNRHNALDGWLVILSRSPSGVDRRLLEDAQRRQQIQRARGLLVVAPALPESMRQWAAERGIQTENFEVFFAA